MKIKKDSVSNNILLIALFISLASAGLLFGLYFPGIQKEVSAYVSAEKNAWEAAKFKKIEEAVVPKEGFVLPISWGDLGPKLIKSGVIDEKLFDDATKLTDEQKNILLKGSTEQIKINADNSQFVVDLLWGIGLAQKSSVYDAGPLTEDKTQVGNYASTGGWTLTKGDPTSYLNKFDLIPLNSDQQKRVMEIAKNVYRPCCDNPTWFPDCNHGMAALAAIEIMVSKNMPDDDVYKNILKLNSFWFTDSYLSIAKYFDNQGTPWNKIDAKKVLGQEYSSATGASLVSKKVGPLPGRPLNGGSCGA